MDKPGESWSKDLPYDTSIVWLHTARPSCSGVPWRLSVHKAELGWFYLGLQAREQNNWLSCRLLEGLWCLDFQSMVVSSGMDLWSRCGNLHRFPQGPAGFLASQSANCEREVGAGLWGSLMLDKQSSLRRDRGRKHPLPTEHVHPVFPLSSWAHQQEPLPPCSLPPAFACSFLL